MGTSFNSQADYLSQQEQFQATRDKFYRDAMEQLGLLGPARLGLAGMTPQPPVQTMPMQHQVHTVPLEVAPDDHLLQAAGEWGIPKTAAANMPREALIKAIQGQQQRAKPEEGAFAQFVGETPQYLAGMVAEFGVGAAKGVTDLLQNSPLVADSLKRIAHVKEASNWLDSLDAGVRASNPTSMSAAFDISKGAGALAGTWYPAMGAWKLAGLAGKLPLIGTIGKFVPAIARAGAQGAATGWLMEGSSENAGMAMAGGAMLGAGGKVVENALVKYAPQLGAAAAKVAGVFKGPADDAATLASGINPKPTVGISQLGPEEATPWSAVNKLRERAADTSLALEDRQSAAEMANQIAVSLNQRGENSLANNIAKRYAGITEADAGAAAAQMNKQAMIVESPALPDITNRAVIDETAVVQAAGASNPGGSSIVEGITDPQRVAEQLMIDTQQSGSQANLRFAKRPGSYRLDALIGHETPITDEMVAQYEQHGLYESQQVLTSKGIEGQLLRITDDGFGLVRKVGTANHPPLRVKLGNLSPSTLSPQMDAAPGMYDGLQQFAAAREVEMTQAMGGAIEPAGWLEPRTSKQLPQTIEDFLSQSGIENPGQRARLKTYFNMRRVEDFSMLAPEESAFGQDVAQQVAEAEASRMPTTTEAKLNDTAATKGFVWIPQPNAAGGVLREMEQGTMRAAGAPMEISFTNEEAALEFAAKMQRELPDVTPQSDVPVEVAAQHITTQHTEPKLENHLVAEDLAAAAGRAAEDVETVSPQGGEGNPPEVPVGEAVAAQQQAHLNNENWGRVLDNVNSFKQRWLTPMRARFSGLESALNDAGLSLIRPFQHYDDISVGMDRAHNWAGPWHDKWATIMQDFGREKMRTGVVTRAYEMLDPAERLAYAQSKGFSEKEIAGLDKMDQFFQEIFPESGIEAARELKRYIPHVRGLQAQGAGEAAYSPFATLNPHVEFFAEHARMGNMQFRELDPRLLGAHYIRSLGFHRFAGEAWENAISTWNEIAKDETLKPVADVFLNWAKVVKRGYQPGDDKVLDVIHKAFNVFMPMSRGEAAQLINLGLGNSHRALLGFRPDVILRDSIQPLMAVPRAGSQVFETINAYTRGTTAEKTAMWERGIKHGWIQAGMPKIELPGFGESVSPGMTRFEADRLGQDPRRKLALAIGDKLHDFLPAELKDIQGTKLDPLYLYTKLGERNRLIVGEAGYQKATSALAKFRASNGVMGEEGLLSESRAVTYDQPIQRKFLDYVAAGQDEEAAAFMGRQLADVTQFRYGVRESPEVARTTAGRIGFQMGNFTTQYWSYVAESLRNGSVTDKAKFLATMGAVAGSLKLAKEVTGWDFDKWQWYPSLAFTGGPWLQAGLGAIQGATTMTKAATGHASDYEIQQAQGNLAAVGQQAGSMLNPLAGAMRTVGGYAQAFDAPGTPEALARMTITGERGTGLQYGDMFRNMGAQALDASTGPAAPNPVRSHGYRINGAAAALPPAGAVNPMDIGGNPVDVYLKHGHPVIDTPALDQSGMVPTHRLDQPTNRLPGESWIDYQTRVLNRHTWDSDTSRVTSVDALEPVTRNKVRALMGAAQAANVQLQIGETARSQSRQELYFQQGRGGNPGAVNTWTLTSDHTGGQAIDFIVNGDPSGRDPGYKWLRDAAASLGMTVDVKNDPGHVSGIPNTPTPGGSMVNLRMRPNAPDGADLNAAIMGVPEALSKFTPDERQFLSRLKTIPYNQQMGIFQAYRASRVGDPQATQQPRASAGPGAGGMF